MGGCRCTFKDCASASHNVDNVHFFHYPVKDPKRCLQWITHAKSPELVDMPLEQLRNKVVCQLHFEDRCFTNEAKKRLVHDAVPTLNVEEAKSPVTSVSNEMGHSNSSEMEVNKPFRSSTASDCPTYSIENGEVVPVVRPNRSLSDQHQVALPGRSYNEQNGVGYTSESGQFRLLYNNGIMPDDDSECESAFWSQSLQEHTSPDPLTIATYTRVDAVKISNTLNEHSKQIAKIRRTLRKFKAMKRRLVQNKNIANYLRRILPPTLFTIVSFHLSNPKSKLNEKENDFIKSLYDSSPATYKFLNETCDWKLPVTKMVIGEGNM